MCGRFVLSNFIEVKDFHNVLIEPSYNIAPSHCTLIFNKEMRPDFLEWGYSPNWAKKPMNLINAKYESLDIKPSFKDYETCVFVADGWFEWKKTSTGEKQPIFIHADLCQLMLTYVNLWIYANLYLNVCQFMYQLFVNLCCRTEKWHE